MYNFFQHVFFGGPGRHDKDVQADCDHEASDSSFEEEVNRIFGEQEIQAASNAQELIREEEEEKARSERKKNRKKRRNERKKLEKAEAMTQVEEPAQSTSNETPKKKVQKTEVLTVSDSEEDLDPTSAFVSVVAKKHCKQVPGLPATQDVATDTYHFYAPDLPEDSEEDQETIISKSRQIALEGNAKANKGHHLEAVELFTESIKLDPSDHRFYGNRSYCYDLLGMFDEALKDADKAIKLCTKWPKGYYRKGRALLGLKKYALAEKYFVEVMKLDNDCNDAITELRRAKLSQIMEKGYTKDIAESALSQYGSVPDALEGLLASGVARIEVTDDMDIFISDDEIEKLEKTPKKPKKKLALEPVQEAAEASFYDIKRDPRNPEGHHSIWIGNVQPDITERKITKMFGKFGELVSVKVLPEKFCAFVNYKSRSSPGKAMQALQGYELSGYLLNIRFPNLPGETPTVTPVATPKKKPGVIGQELKKMGPVNGNECYFWRTTTCIYGENCRYKHIREHKGIDKKTWTMT